MATAQDKRNVIPQIAFNAGEVSAALRGRIDLQKFQQGAAEVTNFVVLPQGPLTRRMGTIHQATLGVVSVPDVPFDPDEEGFAPAYVDPYNWHYIDASMTVGAGTDETLDAKLWNTGGAAAADDPGQTESDSDWSLRVSSDTVMPWLNFDDGVTGGGNSVDWNPTTGDYITIDLGGTFKVSKIWFNFGVNSNTTDPPPDHGIHTIQVRYAEEAQRADGVAYSRGSMTWIAAETIDMTADWAGKTNGSYNDVEKTLTSPITCRYIDILVTDDWVSNGDAANPNVKLEKILLETQITAWSQTTDDLTKTRNECTMIPYASFGLTNWAVIETTGLSGGGDPDYSGTNQMSDMIDGSYPDAYSTPNSLQNTPFEFIIYTFNGNPVELTRLYFVGNWIDNDKQPSKIEVEYKAVTASGYDADWTAHRTFRFPTMNDGTYGPHGDDFATWQQRLFSGGNIANKGFMITMPQKFYWAIKLKVSIPTGETGSTTKQWSVADIKYLNRYLTSGGARTSPFVSTPKFIGADSKWGPSQDGASATWSSITPGTNFYNGFTGTSDGGSRAIFQRNVQSYIENKSFRFTFDVGTNTSAVGELHFMAIEETDLGGSSGTVYGTMANATGGTAYISGNALRIPVGETGTYSVELTCGAASTAYSYFMFLLNESGATVEIDNISMEYI